MSSYKIKKLFIVRSLGAENRSMPVYDEVYEHIIFKASDIKDLVVCELSKLNQEQQSYVNGNNTGTNLFSYLLKENYVMAEPVIQSLESCTPNIKMRQQIPHADVKQGKPDLVALLILLFCLNF